MFKKGAKANAEGVANAGKTTKRSGRASPKPASAGSKTKSSKSSPSSARSKASASKSTKRKAKSAPKSKHFEQAKTRAERVLHDPDATKKLLDAAEKKSEGKRGGKLSEVKEQLAALLRLIRAYAKGDYRAISWESLILIVAAIIYFVSPIDAIPDVLPIGLLDDAVVIAFVIGVVKEELDDFIEWEKNQSS